MWVKFHQVFKSTYLYGVFSPITGDYFLMEFPSCDGACFQMFINELSKYNSDEFKIIVLDNAAFHKLKKLKIPDNIILIFQPPYSPELNPAEKMWAKFKRAFTNNLFYNLKQVSHFIDTEIEKLTKSQVKNICSFEYVFSNSYWTI